MVTEEFEKETQHVCNLSYLTASMNGKKHLILEIIDLFLKQTPEELAGMNKAIGLNNFTAIRSFSHTMKSSVTIMGIAELLPVLQEMEDLGNTETDMDRIKDLNRKLNSTCSQAMREMEVERLQYN
jgi:HPt (histidine-containing phosphotransfer) domain-containing protein